MFMRAVSMVRRPRLMAVTIKKFKIFSVLEGKVGSGIGWREGKGAHDLTPDLTR